MKPTVSPLNFLATIRPDSFTLLLAVLAVVGAAFILASQANYGVGMSGDSAAYVSAARNLLSGNGLIQWDGAIYQDYAPLFPVLLAATGVFGHDLAGYLNAAAFGLTIFVSVMWLRGRVHSRFLVVWATVALVLSLPLVYVSSKAFSEPLFILFTVLALFAINKFLASGHRSAFFLGGGIHRAGMFEPLYRGRAGGRHPPAVAVAAGCAAQGNGTARRAIFRYRNSAPLPVVAAEFPAYRSVDRTRQL